MFKLVIDVKPPNEAPYSLDLIAGHRENILDAVESARQRAVEHSLDIQADKPYRFGNGFQFHTANGSIITYRAEEVG